MTRRRARRLTLALIASGTLALPLALMAGGHNGWTALGMTLVTAGILVGLMVPVAVAYGPDAYDERDDAGS